ncbi:MAG: hypothetical protein ACLFS3_02130 [Candidatus Aenigmatarchaeota archaeon]
MNYDGLIDRFSEIGYTMFLRGSESRGSELYPTPEYKTNLLFDIQEIIDEHDDGRVEIIRGEEDIDSLRDLKKYVEELENPNARRSEYVRDDDLKIHYFDFWSEEGEKNLRVKHVWEKASKYPRLRELAREQLEGFQEKLGRRR